ncbi:hypothetical protein GCM10008967_34670 [Bacillus carboniphilus]|uniref:LysM domain-containing protein n=1 Tax=Bacillus carboniphilus TaxID=86663 RepID=A0ABP3GBA8_9BACI
MKRTLLIITALLFAISLYYDIKVGTLSMIKPIRAAQGEVMEVTTSPSNHPLYIEHLVTSGDTVLSVVEKNLNEPLPVGIEQVVQDFITLNQIQPEKIQAGKVYKFPIYNQ